MTPSSVEVAQVPSSLERVPDSILEILDFWEVSFELIDGDYKDFGVDTDEANLGVYSPGSRSILVKNPSNRNFFSRLLHPTDVEYVSYTILHEYGHAVDYIFGYLGVGRFSVEEEFLDAHYNGRKNILEELYSKWIDKINSGDENTAEIRLEIIEESEKIEQSFAYRFADYYLSVESRVKLKEDHPSHYEYFRRFERDVNAGKHSALLKTNHQ